MPYIQSLGDSDSEGEEDCYDQDTEPEDDFEGWQPIIESHNTSQNHSTHPLDGLPSPSELPLSSDSARCPCCGVLWRRLPLKDLYRGETEQKKK